MALPLYPTLPGLTYPVQRELLFSTLKQDSWSGRSSPIQVWSTPRRRYTLTYDFLRSSQFYGSTGALTEQETLEAFYGSVGGAAGLFLFTDVADQTATAMPFGTGDGVTTTFQLSRRLPGQSFAEPVTMPRAGFTVAIAGTVTTGFATGANPGQIVFAAPPAQGAALTWSGAYDWPCRFDDDDLEFQRIMHGLWTAKVVFTTVKL